jgi:hypothetical protein
MLIIPLPNGETAGKCRINGEPCEFTIADGVFSFRSEGSSEPWDRRKIMSAMEGDTLTNYVCANKNGPTDAVLFVPTLTDDGLGIAEINLKSTPDN